MATSSICEPQYFKMEQKFKQNVYVPTTETFCIFKRLKVGPFEKDFFIVCPLRQGIVRIRLSQIYI